MQIAKPYDRFEISDIWVVPELINDEATWVIGVSIEFPPLNPKDKGRIGRRGFIKEIYDGGRYFTVSDFEEGAAQFKTREEAHLYSDKLMEHIIDAQVEIDKTGYLDGLTDIRDNIISDNKWIRSS